MPPEAPRAAPAAGLRLLTHNVNGLASTAIRAKACDRLWTRLRVDIACVQETHATFQTEPGLQRKLEHYDVTWHHGDSARRGVAIAVRRSLLNSGQLTMGQPYRIGPAGRLLAVDLDWAGHRLKLITAYLPNDAAGQQAALTEWVRPLCVGGRQVVLAGDFNFVERPELDRAYRPRAAAAGVDATAVVPTDAAASGRSASGAAVAGAPSSPGLQWHTGSHHDAATARVMRMACPDLRDVFRDRHPRLRALTYIHSQHASRIDRFYVSAATCTYVTTTNVLENDAISDHRPVLLELGPKRPEAVGSGLPRARTDFMRRHRDLAEDLRQEAERLASAAPADDYAFLIWWPRFKAALRVRARHLRRIARAADSALTQQEVAARALLVQAHDRIAQGLDALQLAVDARARFVAAAMSASKAAHMRERYQWLHAGERPSPVLTRLMRPGCDSRTVPALQDAQGRLVTDVRALPQLVADFWAGLSADAAADPAAQQEVVAAVAAHTPPVQPEEADAVGAADVLPAEVGRALKKARPGRAPGPDGLPVEMYRMLRDVMVPLLARLYSIIGATQQTPPGFLLGAVTSIFKKGSRTVVSNYRPITLLNADYRLLAKCLAERLGPCLDAHIDPSQTAFLKKRSIGENILLMQQLPVHLRRLGRAALLVFCDFQKAYDTVQRPFLMAVMQAVGMGAGFLTWVSTLLGDTRALAVVNGFSSRPSLFRAGVRQGCPLAPLLYLFVGQALLCLLKARGVGVPVEDSTVAACQYADDTEVVLQSPADLPAFVDAMHVFQRASGQALNLDKSEALPVGAVPGGDGAARDPLPAAPTSSTRAAARAAVAAAWQQPPAVGGLQLVGRAVALGIAFSNVDHRLVPASPSADWAALLDAVRSVSDKVCRVGLSAFGRSFAISGYGVSKLLYHAEYGGMPPAAVLEELQRATRIVVDMGRVPGVRGAVPPGLLAELLPGHPSVGGFGLLPWLEHIRARHAVWGLRLIRLSLLDAVAQPAWVRVLLADMQRWYGLQHPVQLLHGWAHPALAATGAEGAVPPGPLQRMLDGLRALPPVDDVGEEPLVLGDWCYAAPLWGNPSLHAARLAEGLQPQRLEDLFPAAQLVSEPPYLRTLGDVAALCLGPNYHLAGLRGLMTRLLAQLPEAWLAAVVAAERKVAAGLIARPTLQEALRVLVPRMGWRLTIRGADAVVALDKMNVRAATEAQLGPVHALRRRHHEDFLALALDLPAGAPVPAERHNQLLSLLAGLWKLKWENENKEVFWRLAVDGLPKFNQACPCGHAHQSRLHTFWDCPVAQRLRAELVGCLPPGTHLNRAAVWLMEPPARCHEGVWRVVCLAALSAMRHGEKQLFRLYLDRERPLRVQRQQQQQLAAERARHDSLWAQVGVQVLSPPPPALPPPALSAAERDRLLQAAGGLAVSFFWERLVEFVQLQRPPRGASPLSGPLGASNPFVCLDAGRLRLRRPAPRI